MSIPETRLGALPNLTYGHLYGESRELPHLQGTGRSGLSPLFYSGPRETPFPREGTLPLFEAEKMYQRSKLAGYTSSTLHAMGALEKPNVKLANLDNEVHPIFGRALWASTGTMPLDYGLPGYYTASNDRVWNALLPSLRLASKFLENAHCWQWWDALIYGERRWIPCPPATRAKAMRTFHRRPPHVIAADRLRADKNFMEQAMKRIRYMINTADVNRPNPHTGQVTSCNAMGYTTYLEDHELSRVTLASQMIGPLIRNDLTDCQRLVIQYQTAKTLLHEFAHAIGLIHSMDAGVEQMYGEPFFEHEVIRELGESMETAIFGGRLWSWPSTQERAFLTISIQNWPNYAMYSERFLTGHGAQLFPGYAYRAGAICESWAIPISWIESLFQRDFWSIYVCQFGGDAVKPYPKLIVQGSMIDQINPDHTASQRAMTYFGPDWNAYMEAKMGAEIDMDGIEGDNPAYHMDAERVKEAFRQCAILEQAVAWHWARTGTYDPET